MQQAGEHTGDFVISRWQAWAPGIESATDWGAWLAGEVAAPADTQPEVNQLPALLRRRLDRLGRMALHTAWPCLEGLDAAAFVFASRHGSLRRTLELLGALAHREPLSPTVFSVSVHNGTAGLYAIARSDHSPATAIGAGRDTLSMGLLEGASMIAAGARHVLVCYADDSLPPPYDGAAGSDGARAPISISLLLEPPVKNAEVCCLTPETVATHETPEAAMLRFLVEHVERTVIGVDQRWCLQRANHAG